MIGTIKLRAENTVIAGTSCFICEDFIPIHYVGETPDRLCNECRKRLKELLYPTADMKGKE